LDLHILFSFSFSFSFFKKKINQKRNTDFLSLKNPS
jgi:hypothetical protein